MSLITTKWMMQLVADIVVHPKLGEHSVDIFVPEWKLAIEYQGGQHYQQTWRGEITRF
jgi:very-short-patch-repair endonuclease